MAKITDWILDETKFFKRHEQRKLRQHVKRKRKQKRSNPRCSWNTWFLMELAFETGLRIGPLVGNDSERVRGGAPSRVPNTKERLYRYDRSEVMHFVANRMSVSGGEETAGVPR